MDPSRTIYALNKLIGKDSDKPITEIFTSLNVAVTVSEQSATSENSQLILTFLSNLLFRLTPAIGLIDFLLPTNSVRSIPTLPKWKNTFLKETLLNMFESIAPTMKVRFNENPLSAYSVVIVIGDKTPGNLVGKKQLFIGSDGWNASVSTERPITTQTIANPFGAYAAAILACSETFKLYLYQRQDIIKSIRVIPLKNKLEFSTFDYSVNNKKSTPDLPKAIELPNLTIVGCGAGGGAALFSLASLSDLKCNLVVIDSDKVVDTNLNRYIYADNNDINQYKVNLVESLFGHQREITVKPFTGPFIEEKGNLRRENFEFVLAAVHTKEARKQIQYETPKIIWDGAATERGEFKIWRIQFGKTQCMRCKHPTENNPEWERAEGVSKITGLSPKAIFKKITNNDFFTEDEIIRIRNFCAKEKLSFELPMEGQAFSDWERNNCGKMNIPQIKEEVPIPFAPVMSGVLLAGEIIKEHYFPDNVLSSQYWNSLLGTFNKHIKPVLCKPKENCPLCKDPAIINQYRRYWKA